MAGQPQNLVRRTFRFAQAVRAFVNRLPRVISNYEDMRQLLRSSGSVAANHIESQEGLSRKDFFYRIKVCRKETRECGLWHHLLETNKDESLMEECARLVSETEELKRIFSAIASKDDTAGD